MLTGEYRVRLEGMCSGGLSLAQVAYAANRIHVFSNISKFSSVSLRGVRSLRLLVLAGSRTQRVTTVAPPAHLRGRVIRMSKYIPVCLSLWCICSRAVIGCLSPSGHMYIRSVF